MPPKKHQKAQSSEITTQALLNYLQSKDYQQQRSPPQHQVQINFHYIIQFLKKSNLNQLQFTSSKNHNSNQLLYSILPSQKTKFSFQRFQPQLKHQLSAQFFKDESSQISKMVKGLVSPKTNSIPANQNTKQQIKKQEIRTMQDNTENSSYMKSQAKKQDFSSKGHQRFNSENVESIMRKIQHPQSAKNKIGDFSQQRKQSEDIIIASKAALTQHQKTSSLPYNDIVRPSLSSNSSAQNLISSMATIKRQSSQLSRAQNQVLAKHIEKGITIVLQYKQNKNKYFIDTSLNNMKWLLEFVKLEMSYLDPSLKIVGVKTHNISVPLDYILSIGELPLQILQTFPYQPLILEPVIFTDTNHLNGPRIGLKDFDFIRCIGMGGFSKVYLVREKSTCCYYAMKLIEKKSILDSNKQQIIQNERDIMAQLKYPFIVKMNAAFESRKYLVFVLEYCSGGELFYLLRKVIKIQLYIYKVKRMTEEQAFFYFAEICLGMKHLHDNCIVYRDIKPENILIDFDGHIRIADFGLSKPNMKPNDIAYSFCGSPEYMAPEMLLKSGHNYQLDLYCLGALLYELVTGLPPYYSRNTDEIYQRILNSKLTFPLPLSADLKDLLTSLLAKNPAKRIDRIENLLSHPWMTQWGDIKLFYRLEQKFIEPPFNPDMFQFNFDEEEFGKGEAEFLREISQLQQNVAENYPKEILLKGFYYNSKENNNILDEQLVSESTGGTQGLNINLNRVDKDSVEYFQQLSQRSGQQKKNLTQKQRLNTLDDCIDNSIQKVKQENIVEQKQFLINQFRVQTDHEIGQKKMNNLKTMNKNKNYL